jgi:hypothetical protein
MRRSRKKFSIYSASPGLENTEKYGTRKYSSKKNKELEKLYSEFIKLHNKKKIKSHDVVFIQGKNRTWKVEAPTITLIKGNKRNYSLKKLKTTVRGKKKTWTVRNKAKSK